MKTISIPVHNRPGSLARVLASLQECPEWHEWKVVVSREPATSSLTDAFALALASLPDLYLSTNQKRLGCWDNTFRAASLAMSLAPTLNLYLEDDYLLSPDALTLIAQWDASGHDGVLCLRRPHAAQDASAPSLVSPLASGLFGCGFAWRACSWPAIATQWNAPAPMWDIAMERLPLPQWRPLVNRSHGIGLIGTHSHGSSADLNLFGPAYAGAPVTLFTFTP